MKKAIIFDVYGTLISTGTGSVDATRKILNNIGFDMEPKEFYKKWKEFHKKQILEMKEFINEEQIFYNDLKMLYEYFGINSDYKKDVQPMLDTQGKRIAFDDTNEVIEELSKDYKIYLGSIIDNNALIADINRNHIKVDGIFTSEYLRTYKPHKEFYEKILNDINIPSNEVVFVGDSIQEDVIAPKQSGMSGILIDRKNKYSKEDIEKADGYINNLYELPKVLKKTR